MEKRRRKKSVSKQAVIDKPSSLSSNLNTTGLNGIVSGAEEEFYDAENGFPSRCMSLGSATLKKPSRNNVRISSPVLQNGYGRSPSSKKGSRSNFFSDEDVSAYLNCQTFDKLQ